METFNWTPSNIFQYREVRLTSRRGDYYVSNEVSGWYVKDYWSDPIAQLNAPRINSDMDVFSMCRWLNGGEIVPYAF